MYVQNTLEFTLHEVSRYDIDKEPKRKNASVIASAAAAGIRGLLEKTMFKFRPINKFREIVKKRMNDKRADLQG